MQIRLKRPTGDAALTLEMFDVLIYRSARQRHQVWIRNSGDLRNKVACLHDYDLEPVRIEAQFAEILNFMEGPPPGC